MPTKAELEMRLADAQKDKAYYQEMEKAERQAMFHLEAGLEAIRGIVADTSKTKAEMLSEVETVISEKRQAAGLDAP